MAAGVRLALRTDSPYCELDVHYTGEDEVHVDLVIDGEVIDSQPAPHNERGKVRFDLPDGEHSVQVWLPQFGRTVVYGLEVADEASVGAVTDDRPRWVTYGSSITQCRAAHSPARTWPAIVARTHGLHLTCLGFGGQCHFDPLVGRTIGLLPADRISLKLGINTYGSASFTQRTWGPAATGLIMTLREHHPATPMLVVSPIVAPPCETTPNRADMTLQMMRQILSDIVQKLRDRGDAHLHYLDGLELLGPDDLEGNMGADGVHPTAAGYELIGRRFADLAYGPNGPLALNDDSFAEESGKTL